MNMAKARPEDGKGDVKKGDDNADRDKKQLELKQGGAKFARGDDKKPADMLAKDAAKDDRAGVAKKKPAFRDVQNDFEQQRQLAQAKAKEELDRRIRSGVANRPVGGLGGLPGPVAGGPPGIGGPGGRPFAPDAPFGQPGQPMALMPPPPPSAEPFIVREYAHSVPTRAEGQERTDFTETVYWHPAVVLDEKGKATVSFQVSDSVTRYRVLAGRPHARWPTWFAIATD